jgi:hypothetical protein
VGKRVRRIANNILQDDQQCSLGKRKIPPDSSKIGSAAAGRGTAMRTVRFLVCVLAFAVFLAPARPQQTPAPKKITITGKLIRVMAIGGETSGWSLELKHQVTLAGKKMRSVEVTGSREELEKLRDQRVTVLGALVHHTGMERGDYMVLEISSIHAVK